MTGDYGSGKSSFALLLAHWFAGHDAVFPPEVRRVVDLRRFGVPRPQFLPVLVTCSREPINSAILKSLHSALSQVYGRGIKSGLAVEVQALLDGKRGPTDDEVCEMVIEVNRRIISDSKAKGLLLILDELGKFLEFSALHPERQDVFLLQRLAEGASRSGDTPLFVVGLLHQGFNAYAEHLDQSAQREWEKVAGRFEEIVFNQPVEQLTEVIAAAINIRTNEVPRPQTHELKQAMAETLSLSWFGSAPARNLSDIAPLLYPLHPAVLPVLIRTFRRFGQNERSLFSFLLSNEPFGLQAFSDRPLREGQMYRLHNFYDYVRASFGHRLATQSYRSHWNLIDSVVESFGTADEQQINILKTVGILNLLNDSDLLPTEESVLTALAGNDATRQLARASLSEMRKTKRVLYDRGRARGLCLWPHTSVDLEKAYEDASRVTPAPQRVSSAITEFLETRPVVARRHYIETGNLRHCDVRYCSVNELQELPTDASNTADGLIVVPLCETASDRKAALEIAHDLVLGERPTLLVGIPQPLSSLGSLVQLVQRWEWVCANTLELNGDRYAREEALRQRLAARSQLERRIQSVIGWKQLSGQMMLDWFYRGRPLRISNGRHLLEEVSRIFDEVYPEAPQIRNELVNRRSLSSAAAAARMRLIERMFAFPGSERLGMDAHKKPPEMSMYLSVLESGSLHRKHGDAWKIQEPGRNDPCHVLPTLRRIRDVVRRQPDGRVNVAELFDELRRPPFGARDGIIPLLLSVFAISHEKEVVFYKDGTFLRDLAGDTIRLLTKAPERFDIQYCKIEGLRADLFEKLIAVLEVPQPNDREIELLDVVRELCVFVARLPSYVLNTKRLSAEAQAVRDAILNAREPSRLVFTDLPGACGFDPIEEKPKDKGPLQGFVRRLKLALDELRIAFPELQERMRIELRRGFDLPDSGRQLRRTLAARSEGILLAIAEPKLRAFCLRLLDDNLPEDDWLESLGSYLALKPPSKWHDAEEDNYNSELSQIALRFQRVEAIMFADGAPQSNSSGVRLAITQANGLEHEQVVHFTPEEEPRLRDLQAQFEALFAGDRRLGLAAASRAIWTSLEKDPRR
jgi:hypothetical protein